MVVSSIILGILFIICGIICMTTPVNTFMNMMWMFAAMLFVYGIFGIIRFFKRRSFVPEFLVSILAVIIGFVYLFRPGNTPQAGTMIGLDRVVLFLTAAWFLIKGCISVYYSVKTRFYNNRWIYGFISGLLSVVLGIYSFMNPGIAAESLGILVGLWFIQSGIDLLILGTTAGYLQNAMEEAEKSINTAIKETQKTINAAIDEAVSSAKEAAREADARKAAAGSKNGPVDVQNDEPIDVKAVEIPIDDPKKPE